MARVAGDVSRTVEQAVVAVYRKVESQRRSLPPWTHRPERELAFDLSVCIASSQNRFEVAVAAISELRRLRLLDWQSTVGRTRGLRAALFEALSREATPTSRSSVAAGRLRFPSRTATLLAGALMAIRESGTGIVGMLRSSGSPRDARLKLINNVPGIGPKQASLFLRRVGFSSDLAVLDRHVLDYMRLCHNVSAPTGALQRIAGYEAFETHFRRIAMRHNASVGAYDLAVWVTMRVAKEEGVL